MALTTVAGRLNARRRRCVQRPAASREAGFTLVELLCVTVIVLITMGMTTAMLMSTQNVYGAQRERAETTHQARAAADTIARLVRMSGNNPFGIAMTPIAANPDGNTNLFDSIRVQADWNPADGDVADPYEDMTFTVAGNQLFKTEPTDAGPVLFADNVQSVVFAYRDTNNNAIANPVASAGAIAFVTVTINTRSTQMVQDGPPLSLTTSVAVRRTE